MRKYVEVCKIAIKNSFAYKFDAVGNAFFAFFTLLLSYILWGGIYKGGSNIEGFTFNMMITYYILVGFLSRMNISNEISERMAEEVRSGNFTKYLTKPISAIGYYFSEIIGKGVFITFCNIFATFLWIVIFNRFFVFNSLKQVIFAILITMLGLFFLALLNYLFVMITFWVLDVSALFMIKESIISLVTGTLVPLNLFPKFMTSFFQFTPFYYVYYYPVTIYLGVEEVGYRMAFGVLGSWCILLLLIIKLLFRKVLKSYEGAGI